MHPTILSTIYLNLSLQNLSLKPNKLFYTLHRKNYQGGQGTPDPQEVFLGLLTQMIALSISVSASLPSASVEQAS